MVKAVHNLRAESLDFTVKLWKPAAIFVVERVLATEGNTVLAEVYMYMCTRVR